MYAKPNKTESEDISLATAAHAHSARARKGQVEMLRDGTWVMLRPVHLANPAVDDTFLAHLSARSRRFHFVPPIGWSSQAQLMQLSVVHPLTDVAYVASAGSQRIAVGRFRASPEGNTCEFALQVREEWHSLGLGTLLMQRLIQDARTRGICFMHSSNKSDNTFMRLFADQLNLHQTRDPEDATTALYSLQVKKCSDDDLGSLSPTPAAAAQARALPLL